MGKANFNRERHIGEYTVALPEPPPLKKIHGYGLPQKKQMFTPPVIPRELEHNIRNEINLSEEEDAFLAEQWDYRINGYWFFNNGNIEYITGNHWFYISYWKIPVVINSRKVLGLPSFVDSDRDYFYVWDDVVQDSNSFGLLHVTNRRDGKTHRGCCTLYYDISMTPESKGGIQSKTNDDAKNVVFRYLINSWQKLPVFWKPIDTGETRPASVLRFDQPSKRGGGSQFKDYSNVLRSEIDYKNLKEEAYDGEALYRKLDDEIGKTVDCDVSQRFYISRECLADGNRITGKYLLTTTVEEMERKGGANCKKLWDASDPKKTNEYTGRTPSGLKRYFKPASYGYRGEDVDNVSFIDEYGYSDKNRAEEYILNVRKGLEGEDLNSYIRKYPLTAKEAFIADSSQSSFDIMRIETQKEWASNLQRDPRVQGDFMWKNGDQDTEVEWHVNPKGKWTITWLPDYDDRNKMIVSDGQRRPVGTSIVGGIDPFDHFITTDNEKSDAASYNFLKHNPLDPFNSHCFISEYINRPPSPEIFYEDMIMESVFFGSMRLIENNKVGIINYFRTRGYYSYLMERPLATHTNFSKARQQEKGIPMTGDAARQALIDALVSYIYGYIGYDPTNNSYGNMHFDKLMEDWIKFDTNNWTPHDPTVASGLTLLALLAPKIKEAREIENFMDFLPKFDQSGDQSKRIN